ncbi:MAG: hypothetical protein MJK18_06275 [Bdellovibrionales bacterium]|nr:hypothetical protein [Bdellovibrionales bacterium]
MDNLLSEKDITRLVYLNLKTEEFVEDHSENALKEDMGIFPDEALKRALDSLKAEWTQAELFHIFKQLMSVRFVRCGKTAVVFELENKEKYIIIFDQQKIIHKSFEGDVA